MFHSLLANTQPSMCAQLVFVVTDFLSGCGVAGISWNYCQLQAVNIHDIMCLEMQVPTQVTRFNAHFLMHGKCCKHNREPILQPFFEQLGWPVTDINKQLQY